MPQSIQPTRFTAVLRAACLPSWGSGRGELTHALAYQCQSLVCQVRQYLYLAVNEYHWVKHAFILHKLTSLDKDFSVEVKKAAYSLKKKHALRDGVEEMKVALNLAMFRQLG